MASTVTQVITKFRTRHYPTCPQAIASELFTESYRELATMFHVRNETVYQTPVLNQRIYDLSPTVVRIFEARWYSSANDFTSLIPITEDELRHRWPDNLASFGAPLYYYTSTTTDGATGKLVVGYYPIPDVTPSGGYPTIALSVTLQADLASGDEVSDVFITDDAILYDMCVRWAAGQDEASLAKWMTMRDDARGNLAAMSIHRVEDTQDVFMAPDAMRWLNRSI